MARLHIHKMLAGRSKWNWVWQKKRWMTDVKELTALVQTLNGSITMTIAFGWLRDSIRLNISRLTICAYAMQCLGHGRSNVSPIQTILRCAPLGLNHRRLSIRENISQLEATMCSGTWNQLQTKCEREWEKNRGIERERATAKAVFFYGNKIPRRNTNCTKRHIRNGNTQKMHIKL